MPVNIPTGTEIVAPMLVILASVLALVVKRVMSGPSDHNTLPSDQVQTNLRPVMEKLDAMDRQSAQRAQSIAEGLSRQLREKERDDRQQFDRLHDKLDRKLNGKG